MCSEMCQVRLFCYFKVSKNIGQDLKRVLQGQLPLGSLMKTAVIMVPMSLNPVARDGGICDPSRGGRGTAGFRLPS